MKDILSLYQLAQQQSIPVLRFPLPENGSMSVQCADGSCLIGMDKSVQDGGVQERVHLAHELGHCLTGSFYSPYTRIDSRRRHEYRAEKRAVQELVSVEALDDAVAEGCTELWELAERFGVTEEFMKKAVCYYTHGNVASELYF